MSFVCADCLPQPGMMIAGPGFYLYRVCTLCGPGWFNNVGVRAIMIQSASDFTNSVDVSTLNAEIYIEDAAIGVVLRNGASYVVAYPFPLNELLLLIDRGGM